MCFPTYMYQHKYDRVQVFVPLSSSYPSISLDKQSFRNLVRACVWVEGREKNSGTREAYDNWRFRRP